MRLNLHMLRNISSRMNLFIEVIKSLRQHSDTMPGLIFDVPGELGEEVKSRGIGPHNTIVLLGSSIGDVYRADSTELQKCNSICSSNCGLKNQCLSCGGCNSDSSLPVRTSPHSTESTLLSLVLKNTLELTNRVSR